MAVLRVKKGPLEGAEFPVFRTRQPTVIGRDAAAEISLEDQRASRRHAAIVFDHGRWILEDLGSSNGTILKGRRITKVLLREGMSLQIGSYLFSFHEDALAVPPADELYGARLLETLSEEGGVFVCRAYQHALDREVRADWLHPSRRPHRAILKRLSQAIDAARTLAGDHLVPLLRGSAGDAAASPRGGIFTVLRGTPEPCFEAQLGQILPLDLDDRVALFHQLVEQVLERSSQPALRYSIGLASVGVTLRSDGPPQLSVPALDLGAFLGGETGNARHSPLLAPYLAPECQSGSPEDSHQAVVYNLGALGYHILTGQAPMGDGDVETVLENHRSLLPAPANLLEKELPEGLASLLSRMLQKDPDERPSARSEIMEVLLEGAAPKTEAAAPGEGSSGESTGSDIEDLVWDEVPAAPVEAERSPATPRRRRPGLRRARRRSSGLLYLPFWVLLWVGLFFGARHLAKIAFREWGL